MTIKVKTTLIDVIGAIILTVGWIVLMVIL